MDQSKQEFERKSLEIESKILSAFQNPRGKQTQIADLLDISPSAVTDIKTNEVNRIARILAAAGLKVVSESWKEQDPEELSAYRTLAKKYLSLEGGE